MQALRENDRREQFYYFYLNMMKQDWLFIGKLFGQTNALSVTMVFLIETSTHIGATKIQEFSTKI